MTLKDVATYRLFNQQLLKPQPTSPTEVVNHFGAMQAQDYAMAKWAIGIRSNTNEQVIEKAINGGEILRTHLLRPTWHFVSANDIRWMLELTAPHLKRVLAGMCRRLELSELTLQRCRKLIEQTLSGNKHCTREEIMLELNKERIATNDIRSAMIMMDAELDSLVCNGPMRGKQFTYALLHERVPAGKSLARIEALAELAKRYFSSHGPATLQDFGWWSGLALTDCKIALELVKNNFDSSVVDNQTYWFNPKNFQANGHSKTILFLPAYDEFMISYKDRSASLEPAVANETISGNGIFKPIIVEDGKVTGYWKRSFKKDSLVIESHYFKTNKKQQKKLAFKAAERYGNFLGMKTVVE
jgi:hypothetical protein